MDSENWFVVSRLKVGDFFFILMNGNPDCIKVISGKKADFFRKRSYVMSTLNVSETASQGPVNTNLEMFEQEPPVTFFNFDYLFFVVLGPR